MSGLVVGERYEFQWWSNASGGTGSVLTTATAGNSVTLATSPSGGQGQVGQFALGTFIADNAAQVVTFDGPVQDILNGFQLRQLGPVHATWLGNVSSDWNSGTNWIGGSAPVTTNDTATFDTSTNTSPTLSANATIDSITFNPGASVYTIQTAGNVLTLEGLGIINNSGSVQTIDNTASVEGVPGVITFANSATAGTSLVINNSADFSLIAFINNSNAGSATINNNGQETFTGFFDNSSAGNATISNVGAGTFTQFNDTSTAANATITNSGAGSFTVFGPPQEAPPSTATAANATIINSGINSFTTFNQQLRGGTRRSSMQTRQLLSPSRNWTPRAPRWVRSQGAGRFFWAQKTSPSAAISRAQFSPG
jgi:hypothetical protein